MLTISISKVKGLLNSVQLVGDSLLIEGVHGIGKSEIVSQWGKENNVSIEELFLSHQDIGDLVGIPHTVVSMGETITHWAKPVWLQRMEKAVFPDNTTLKDLEIKDTKFKEYLGDLKGYITAGEMVKAYNSYYDTTYTINSFLSVDLGILSKKGKPVGLFLDELNRAQKEQKDMGLQLVLSRQIHEHKLPVYGSKKAVMVAAVNPSDLYQVSELDPALLDRFLHVFVEPDVEGWLLYSKENGVNQVTRDFIIEYPEKLHFMPEEGSVDVTSATPRSWTMLAKHVDNFDDIPESLWIPIITGKIGSAIGSQFYTFYKEYHKVIKVEDIEEASNSLYNGSNFEMVTNAIKELTIDMEAISLSEMAGKLQDKFLTAQKKQQDMIPYLAFLYSLPFEGLNGYLKGLKENRDLYNILVKKDFNKGLFLRIVNAQEGL